MICQSLVVKSGCWKSSERRPAWHAQAADLASSGGALAAAVLGAQLQRQSASLGSMASISASGTPRIASHISTPSASLDKLQREDLLMHELDQVLPPPSPLTPIAVHGTC